MTTLIHADIFFFIASIGCILLIICGIIIAIMVIELLGSINRISKKVEGDVDSLSADAKALVADVRGSIIYRMIFKKRQR